MPNPALNDKLFEQERQAGWAAGASSVPPAPDTISTWPPPGVAQGGPADPGDLMTVRGTASATSVLLVLLLITATFGWSQVEVTTDRFGNSTSEVPALLIVALLVGLGLAFLTIFKPNLARITAPLYALAEGFVVGAISHIYEAQFKGIVLQAVGLTIAVFVFMLGAFASGRIRVTEKLRMGIMAGTLAIGAVYLVTLLLRVFGTDVPMIHDSGLVGIGFSLVVVGIASAKLLLDFDFVQRAVAARTPKRMEWFAAFGLMVTLVWLYLELLRLLSKLRDR